MRRVVLMDPLYEEEIRPRALFDRYLELLTNDIGKLLDPATSRPRDCPACCSPEAELAFEKIGFSYQRCLACGTLYASPCPTDTQLADFYQQAKAMAYWREQFSAETAAVRKPDILQPRVDWVVGMISAYFEIPVTFLDLDHKYPYFLAQLYETGIIEKCYIAASLPGLPMSILTQGSSQFQAGLFEESSATQVNAVTAFEVIERVVDLLRLLQACNRWLRRSGLLFITTISGAGFDVRLLGERVRHVVPPTHLNLLSRRGFQTILEQTGFELLEFSTPGRLDVELVAQAKAADPDLPLPPILSELVASEDEEIHSGLQRLIQQARLSSHVRIVARRR